MTNLRRIVLLLVCMLMIVGLTTTASAARPTIIACSPSAVYAEAGETVTLFVEAEGDDLTYRWSSYHPRSEYLPPYEARTDSTLTLTMIPELDGVDVFCTVTDSSGNKVNTYEIDLYLPVLEILEEPENMELIIGMTATTHLKATGSGLKYQWYYYYEDDDENPIAASSSGPNFSFMPRKAGCYYTYCVITDSSGQSVKSYVARFDVYDPIYIQNDISDVSVHDSDNVCLKFVVDGCNVTYKWYKKPAGSKTFTLTDVTQDYYSFTMDAGIHKMQLYCVATDMAGNTVTSSVATMTMDTSLHIRGDCTICGGDGKCNTCGGDGWYDDFGYNGSSHETVEVRCPSGLCDNGACRNCFGSGWVTTKRTPGDADSNGAVDARDVLLILQHAAGWNVTIDKQTANVAGAASLSIDTKDAVRLMQYIAGN